MKDSNPPRSVLFVFAKDVSSTLVEIAGGTRAISHCYWYHRFRESHPDIEYIGGPVPPGPFSRLFGLLSRIVFYCSGIGFNIELAVANWKHSHEFRTLFCTCDSVALPFLLLKRFGLVRAEIVYQTIGLYDHWRIKRNPLFTLAWRWLCGAASVIVCYGPEERQRLIAAFSIPGERVIGIRTIAGFDTEFFSHFQSEDGDYVLSVGRDKCRDFRTFCEAMAKTELPGILVHMGENLGCAHIPSNVREYVAIPYPKIVELYRKARVVVVALHNNTYTAGWVVAGEAMSLGKPVVMTRVDAMNGMDGLVQSGTNCKVVPREDPLALADVLIDLYSHAAARRSIGEHARRTAEQYSKTYVETLSSILFPGFEGISNVSQV